MIYKKKEFITAFELLLNTLEGLKITEFFGQGTTIKIRDIILSPVKKSCLIDCILIYGTKIIAHEKDDDKFITYLVLNTAELFISDYVVKVMVGYNI